MTRSEFFKAIGLTALSLGVFKLVGDPENVKMFSVKDIKEIYKNWMDRGHTGFIKFLESRHPISDKNNNPHGKTLWYSNDGITWEEQVPVNLSTQNMGKIPPYVTWNGKIYKLTQITDHD